MREEFLLQNMSNQVRGGHFREPEFSYFPNFKCTFQLFWGLSFSLKEDPLLIFQQRLGCQIFLPF